ncbi:MAG: hypothetical protein U0793_30800 [Gemmataceae bacterium]
MDNSEKDRKEISDEGEFTSLNVGFLDFGPENSEVDYTRRPIPDSIRKALGLPSQAEQAAQTNQKNQKPD